MPPVGCSRTLKLHLAILEPNQILTVYVGWSGLEKNYLLKTNPSKIVVDIPFSKQQQTHEERESCKKNISARDLLTSAGKIPT